MAKKVTVENSSQKIKVENLVQETTKFKDILEKNYFISEEDRHLCYKLPSGNKVFDLSANDPGRTMNSQDPCITCREISIAITKL